MNVTQRIIPNVSPRQCGGWLAISPPHAPIRIGVTASTESEVREKFMHSMNEWIKNLNSE